MSRARWMVSMKLEGGGPGIGEASAFFWDQESEHRELPPDTHTHTHPHTHTPPTHTHPGPCWLRENSNCYSGHFSTGSWNPGSWRPASCLLLKLYLKTGGGLVTMMCPTLVTPWTIAFQASLSMGFSRQEYWSWLPFPPPGDLPNPRIEPGSPAFQADSLPTELRGKPIP